MQPDLRTLFIVLTAICLMQGLVLAFYWSRQRTIRHLLYWSATFLIATAGLTLLALRTRVDPWLSISFGNALVLAAFGFARAGARAFDGKSPAWGTIVAAPAIWIVACQIPAFYASFAWRIALVSLLVAAICAVLAVDVWSERHRERLSSRLHFALLCWTHSVVSVGRAGYALATGITEADALGDLVMAATLLEPVLALLAAIVLGFALTRERLHNELQRSASIDGLTGALNRSAFLDRAQIIVETARREQADVALLVFDLDRFKAINDRFGHAAGDAALGRFGETARLHLRQGDLFGRIGGEEFAALLPGADADNAWQIAERIRIAYARKAVQHAGEVVATTVSIGVAAARGGEANLDPLMARADAALYEAKRAGRDLVWRTA